MSRPLNRSSMSLVAAVLLGITQMYLLTILWGYISAYTHCLGGFSRLA
jgi:hypothetical protein